MLELHKALQDLLSAEQHLDRAWNIETDKDTLALLCKAQMEVDDAIKATRDALKRREARASSQS